MANLKDLASRFRQIVGGNLISPQPWNKSGNKFQDQSGWFRGGKFTPGQQVGEFVNRQREETWKPTGIGYKAVMGARNLLGTDQSTAGNYLATLSNVKRFELPRLQTPYKGLNFASNLAVAVPESLINIPRNLVVGPSRVGLEIKQAVAEGRKVSPLRIAQGVAPTVEGLLDMVTFGSGSAVKQGAKELIKGGTKQAIKKGAAIGGLGGLTYGLDRQYGQDFRAGQLAGDVGAGMLLGGTISGSLSASTNMVSRIKKALSGDVPVQKVKNTKAQLEKERIDLVQTGDRTFVRKGHTPTYEFRRTKEQLKRIDDALEEINKYLEEKTQGFGSIIKPVRDEAGNLIPTKPTIKGLTPEVKQITVYHGTSAKIKSIGNLKTGTEIAEGGKKLLYVSDNPEYARTYGENVVSGEIKGKILDIRKDFGNTETRKLPPEFSDFMSSKILDSTDKRVFNESIAKGQAQNYIFERRPNIVKYMESKGVAGIRLPRTEQDLMSGVGNEILVFNKKYISQSGLTPEVKQNEALLAEARKYKSAEEFAQFEGKTLFRGTDDYGDKLLQSGTIPKEGLPVTLDPSIANKYAKSRGLGGYVIKKYLDPNAKIISLDEIPNTVRSSGEGTDFAGRASIWARNNGYDVLDMTKGNEVEMRILNKNVLVEQSKQKSQLTDIYNQAKGLTPEVTQPIKIYRGGTSDSKYYSTSKNIAEDFAKNRGGSVVEKTLSPNAKVISYEDIPTANFKGINDYNMESFGSGKDLLSFQNGKLEADYTKAENWAKQNGYDAVKFPTEGEIRVINPKILSGLTPEVTTVKQPVQNIPLTRETMRIVPETVQETVKSTSNIRISKQPKTIVQESNIKSQKSKSAKTLDNIISTSGIDVKSKVNLLDYIRTPDRVLKKIGLGGESVKLRRAYDSYLAELPKEIDKITQWSKQVPTESNQRIFKYLDGQKVLLNVKELKVAKEIQSYLSEWADKLGLEKSKRITNYITHIFDKDFIQKEFDPDIARLIKDRVAGSVYDPFTEKRLGKMGYIEDTWKALDAYVKRATRKVNMDPVLASLKEKSKGLEDSQFNYIKTYTDRINMRPTAVDNLLDNTIKSIVGYKFGQRPVSYLSNLGRQAVYRGALGLNVGSALRNLSQGANTYAKLGNKYTAKGYIDLLKKGTKELEDVGVLRDDLIQDRTISATKQAIQKMDKVLFSLFETAEKINRGSAYYGAKAKAIAQGLSESEAIDYAKNIVRDTQFTFGRIDTPVALQSDIAKIFSQFQSFTLKQGEFLGEMASKKDLAGLARYTAATLAYVYTIGQLFGMELKDIIPSFRFNAPPSVGLPYEIGKTLITGKDKYGNELEPTEKVQQIGNAAIPYVPAGVQGKKTITGIRDVSQGGAYTPGGKLKYPIDETVGNYVRGGLFGPYNLPEAKEYRKLDTSALSEKQTKLVKESSNPKETYKEIINKRLQDREIDSAKEILKNSNQPTSKVGNVYLIKQDDGSIDSIDISKEIKEPTYTGNPTIDKKLRSDYRSQLTKRTNNIIKLYQAGQISLEEAEKLIDSLESYVNKTKTVKSGKKVSVKIKNVDFSLPKFGKLKQTKPKTIKIAKPKKGKKLKSKIRNIKIIRREPRKIKVRGFKNTLANSGLML